MKTIATYIIIGLAAGLRMREADADAQQPEYEITDAEFCNMISGETYDDLKAELGEEEAPTREEFGEWQADCAAGSAGPDHGSGDEKDGDTDGDDNQAATSDSGDDKAEGTSDDNKEGSSDDEGEGSSDDEDDSSDSSDDSEFAYWCERIGELPEGTTWDDVKDDLAAEFGEDAPAEEEFVAVTWACKAAEHEAIEDFEEVCAMIAEHVDPETPWDEIEAVLAEELGSDAPTEEEWNDIVWACEAAAEYGDEDSEEEKPEGSAEAQIKDDEFAMIAALCEVLAGLPDDADWSDLEDALDEQEMSDEPPTGQEFEDFKIFCDDLADD